MVLREVSANRFHALRNTPDWISSIVWAATTYDEDFMRMEAMKRLVSNESHRKEIVAGNFAEYLTNRMFCSLSF